MRRAFLQLIAVLALWAGMPAVRAEIPLPQRGNHSVYDLAGVIDAADAATMERQQAALYRACGVAIVVITVPELDDEPIGDFAVRVGQSWGVGRKGQDRGLVVALAVAERKIFIATGYGTEGYLPDGRVGRLLDEYVVPHLQRNEFSRGMLEASSALVKASAEEYGVEIASLRQPVPAARGSRNGRDGRGGGIVAILMAVVFLYLAIRHPRLLLLMIVSGMFRGGRGGFGGGGFGGGGGGGFGGFGGGGFGGGGAGRGF